MAKLYVKNNQIVIDDETIPADAMCTVYRGPQPTLTIEDKEKVGTFSGNPITFSKSAADDDQRQYYVYQFEQEQKIIASRNVALEGTFNCRDLGGYETEDGKIVKWGQLFRSDALNYLTDRDIAYLEQMNLRTVVDFRGKNEIESAPDRVIPNVNYQYLNPNADVAALATGNLVDDQEKIRKLIAIADGPDGAAYFDSRLNEMADQMRELVSTKIANRQYGKFLTLLTQADTTPLLEHCKGGKDRAGFAAILILLVLGVPQTTIIADYMMTKENMKARNEKRMDEYRAYTDHPVVLRYLQGLMETKELYIAAAFDEIEKMGGRDHYLTEIMGVSADMIAQLREKYLYCPELITIQ